MKINSLFLIFILGLGSLFSCQEMDLVPKGTLGEDALWGNEAGLKVYFTRFYHQLPIEDFTHYGNNTGYRGGWEAMKYRLQNCSGEFVNTWTTVQAGGTSYLPWTVLRELNNFINNFNNYESLYTPVRYNEIMGEARFFRAFMYFGMVKRFGGVPIITDVQFPTDPEEITMVHRQTEYDTWKFIYEDLKFAIENMTSDTKVVYTANKYAAAALMCKTMLYAATNAKYDEWLGFTSTEDAYNRGFAGMRPSVANEFFQYAYDAGKVVESGGYSLYMKYPNDLATNFANLFLDADSPENIFIKAFDRYSPSGATLRHQWDSGMLPNPQLSNFVGSQSYPALDFMRTYDFPDIVDADGYPIRYEKRGDIREGIEPRLRGSVWFNGDVLREVEFEVMRGNYKTFTWKADVIVYGDNNDAPNLVTNIDDPAYPGTTHALSNRILSRDRYGRFDLDQYNIPRQNNATGKYRYQADHGLRDNEGGENNCTTGAFVRKYVDPTNTNTADYGSSTDWIVFRLGEVYTMMAEICYEMGRETEAFDYIEKLRTRAGCKEVRPAIDKTPYWGNTDGKYNAYTYPFSIDASLQFIREERNRETWGENQYWWDIRRWRVAEFVRSSYRPRALACYYVIDEDKYIYLDERIKDGSTWTCPRNVYYQSLPNAEILLNPNYGPQNPLR